MLFAVRINRCTVKNLTIEEALAEITADAESDEHVKGMVEFINGSSRGIIR